MTPEPVNEVEVKSAPEPAAHESTETKKPAKKKPAKKESAEQTKIAIEAPPDIEASPVSEPDSAPTVDVPVDGEAVKTLKKKVKREKKQ